MKQCEYAKIRKDLLGQPAYAKCKKTGDDCWQYYDRNRCNHYQNKNPKKIFFMHKGNYHCLQDMLEKA